MITTRFVLSQYLDTLSFNERNKPDGERRQVPTHTELAKLVGMEPTPFSRMVNNKTDMISRRRLGVIVAELRRRGFDATYNDLLVLVD